MEIGFIGCGRQATEHAKALRLLDYNISFCVGGSETSHTAETFSKVFGCPKLSIDQIQNTNYDRLVVTLPYNALNSLRDVIEQCNVPVLVDKPYSFEHTNSNPNISIGYNRRFYHTIQVLKNLIKTKQVEYCSFIINEMITQKSKKHDMSLSETELYSFGHAVDLFFYLKLDQYQTNIKLLRDKFSNTELTIYFTDGTVCKMISFEELKVFNNIDISNQITKKYIPKVKDIVKEPLIQGIKEGILFQMKEWLEDKPLCSIEEEQRVFKFIKENSPYS